MGAASQPIPEVVERPTRCAVGRRPPCIAAEHLLSGKTATVHYCCGDGDLAR